MVAYTIAIVQNTQILQFDQMQVALQTAQNHASIETLLKAEQLMTAHFNLAILTDNTASNTVKDTPPSETGVPDPGPTAPALDEETICKALHTNSHANKHDRYVQPTSTVLPTYRAEPRPVRGILAGYESDNSWDFSDAGEADCSQLPRPTPLVANTLWRGCPHRGRNKTMDEETTLQLGAVTHPIRVRDTINCTADKPEVRKCSVPEPTTSGNAVTTYRKLIHRRSASLDLETAFKCIKIAHELKPAKIVKRTSANAQPLRQRCHAPLHPQRLPSLTQMTKIYPSWLIIYHYTVYTHLHNLHQMKRQIGKLQQFAVHQYITG